MSDVAANWRAVRDRVHAAAQRAGRPPDRVRIVAVAKTKPAELVAQVLAAGATDIGENYVQEAAAKIPLVAAPAVWHFVGHLQRNKARRAVELFDTIHTVDSAALGAALARHAAAAGKTLRVLIEVNIGGEATKSGVAPNALDALLRQLGAYPALRIEGLMAIPPPVEEEAAARRAFAALRDLRDRHRATAPDNAPLHELSMGMTDDFEAAIAEGATIVRIGRAIFGERPHLP